jgi:hypothetical protein
VVPSLDGLGTLTLYVAPDASVAVHAMHRAVPDVVPIDVTRVNVLEFPVGAVDVADAPFSHGAITTIRSPVCVVTDTVFGVVVVFTGDAPNDTNVGGVATTYPLFVGSVVNVKSEKSLIES